MRTTPFILESKLRKLLAHLPYLFRGLRLLWSAAPLYASIWAALLVFQGLLPIPTVYLTRSLVNTMLVALRAPDPWSNARPTLLAFGAIACLLLIAEGARVATGWVRAAQAELIQDHISGLIHRKSLELDLAFYDTADFYDHLHRARSEAGHRPVALLENMGGMLQNSITLASMLAILIPFGLWMPVVLLASTLPSFYIVLRQAVEQHSWRMRVTPDERRCWYYDWVLTAVETAAEARLFGLGDHFQSAFQTLRSRLRSERMRLAFRQAVAELVAGSFALLAAGGALAWMARMALRHEISPGDLAMVYQAFQQGMRLSRSFLEHVGQFYSNTLFLGNMFEFLSLEPTVLSPISSRPAPSDAVEMRFRRVSFRYPGTNQWALHELDLEIPARQITAIVGANGAGKSTLLKLLCRFYDPDEGSVELGGHDLRILDLSSLRRSMTVLFQQPVHYNASAAENISLGDIKASRSRPSLEQAAMAAGADAMIQQLPAGYDQLLGRWFDNGIELSTGQWQQLALARAFLRQAPVLILDEPTSAMDPWAEAEWLRRFRILAAGRTVVVITHRFSTARIADSAYVLSDGKAVEHGSHEELLAQKGRYAEGWFQQAAATGGSD